MAILCLRGSLFRTLLGISVVVNGGRKTFAFLLLMVVLEKQRDLFNYLYEINIISFEL